MTVSHREAQAPSSVTVEPSGKFLYVTNQGDNTVSAFSIDGSGNLSELILAGSPYPTATAPAGSALATTATGSYLYVANSGSNNISAFIVCLTTIAPCTAADGSLISVASLPVGAGLTPVGIVVDPTNTFVYTIDQDSNQISGYRLNAANGGLSRIVPCHGFNGNPADLDRVSSGREVPVRCQLHEQHAERILAADAERSAHAGDAAGDVFVPVWLGGEVDLGNDRAAVDRE